MALSNFNFVIEKNGKISIDPSQVKKFLEQFAKEVKKNENLTSSDLRNPGTGRTVLDFACLYGITKVIKVICELLPEKDFKELIENRDVNGENILHMICRGIVLFKVPIENYNDILKKIQNILQKDYSDLFNEENNKNYSVKKILDENLYKLDKDKLKSLKQVFQLQEPSAFERFYLIFFPKKKKTYTDWQTDSVPSTETSLLSDKKNI